QGTVVRSFIRSARATSRKGPLKIGYFGRLDWSKGPDLLAQALARIPSADVRVDIFAIRQPTADVRSDQLLAAQSLKDKRLRVLEAVPPDKVTETMAQYDLVAVPSRWLETGPLVALEAFAAGVPVLGAKLGGIAELLRDGIDGILVAPDDADAWASA